MKAKVIPKCLSPTEVIQTPNFKSKPNEIQKKKRGQKPGWHKPPPLRMNLVLEIRLLGKTILDNVSLEIHLVPKSILPLCDGPTELCKTCLLRESCIRGSPDSRSISFGRTVGL